MRVTRWISSALLASAFLWVAAAPAGAADQLYWGNEGAESISHASLAGGGGAEIPITGRAVLLDIEESRADTGRPLDHGRGEVLEVSDLDACLHSQGVTLRRGDIALVHTGWAHWYLQLPDEERIALRDRRLATGFAQRLDLPRWLWEHRIAAFATDTFAVERLPVIPDSAFADTAVDDAGMMHQELIAKLGIPLGELWNLHELAIAARADRRWDSFLVAKPLHLTGGVGSPANATAVR